MYMIRHFLYCPLTRMFNKHPPNKAATAGGALGARCRDCQSVVRVRE